MAGRVGISLRDECGQELPLARPRERLGQLLVLRSYFRSRASRSRCSCCWRKAAGDGAGAAAADWAADVARLGRGATGAASAEDYDQGGGGNENCDDADHGVSPGD